MEQLTARLVEFWNSLNTWQRFVVIGIPAVLVIGAIALLTTFVGTPPTQSVLFADVDPADAQLILEQLETDGVSYDLLNDGRDIVVPTSQVHRLRINLASQGLPRGHVGFELFETPKMGITDTGMQIDKQRALQGELARTLESMEQVDKATVILAMAPDTSFLDTDSHSTGAVTLTLQPGERLNEMQVEGIRHLVSRSVRRLEPEDVAITDNRANPLTGKDDAGASKLLAGMDVANMYDELRQHIERRYERKIRQVLEGPYGIGSVAAAVTLEIDNSVIRNQIKEYTPVTSDEQGIERNVEEHRSRTTATEENLGGIPGTTSNVPGYLGINQGENTGQESSEYDLIVEYLVNEKLSDEELWPGAITRRSAAVSLNTDTWDETIKQTVEQLVARAIGASVTSGDDVFVQGFTWSERESQAIAVQSDRRTKSRTLNNLFTMIGIAVIVALGLVFLRSLVLGGLPREMALPGVSSPDPSGRSSLMTEEEAEEFALRKLDELGATQQEKMRQEISKMVDNEPDRVVALLRSWMLEDT